MSPDRVAATSAGRGRCGQGEICDGVAEHVSVRLSRYYLDHFGEVVRPALDGSTVVAVGHGFALRVATVLLLGLDYAHNLTLGGLWNASWSVLQPGGESWRLLSYNNVAG